MYKIPCKIYYKMTKDELLQLKIIRQVKKTVKLEDTKRFKVFEIK
jgi:hypothetical protein